ncbi:MAG: hypothetical protein M0Z82_07825 [Actinomycetota bacterium]|jgi:hypothetical protein|nr:hypothetical protein [Actinomycetota bacterium]
MARVETTSIGRIYDSVLLLRSSVGTCLTFVALPEPKGFTLEPASGAVEPEPAGAAAAVR